MMPQTSVSRCVKVCTGVYRCVQECTGVYRCVQVEDKSDRLVMSLVLVHDVYIKRVN